MISARQLLVTFAPAMGILMVVVIAKSVFQVDVVTMTRDVTGIAGIHPLSGFLSSLGTLLWCATAAICGFSAFVVRGVRPRTTFWFLACSALLSAYLLFDDLFLFHEKLAPWYLGLNEEIVFATLGFFVASYLVAFRRTILQTKFAVLVLALGFLATSVAIDTILEPWTWRLGEWTLFFEDGPKWLGIASWCSYYVHTCCQLIPVHHYGHTPETLARREPSGQVGAAPIIPGSRVPEPLVRLATGPKKSP